jgi:hypothetical protein
MKNKRVERQMLLEDIGELHSTLPDSRYREYLGMLTQSAVPGGIDYQLRHLQTVYNALSRRHRPVYLQLDLNKLDKRTRTLVDG